MSLRRRLGLLAGMAALLVGPAVAIPGQVARANSSVDCAASQADSTRVPSSASHVVVLVHGWDGTPDNWSSRNGGPATDSFLNGQLGGGYTFLRFSYATVDSQWAADPRISQCLASYLVAAAGAASDHKVVVVAHSMGGIATLFAMTTGPNAAQVRAVTAGLITLGTPYLGSPWGDTALASLAALSANGSALDVLHAQVDHTPAAIIWQSGSLPSGARCLAPPSRLPRDCTPVPKVPSNLPVAAYGGDVQLQRTFFGHVIATDDVGGDAIVPVASAGVGARQVGGAGETYLTTCTLSPGAAKEAASVAGLSTDTLDFWESLLGGGRSGALLAGDRIPFDVSSLTDGGLALLAPCSHTNLPHDGAVLTRAAQQIRLMFSSADTLTPPQDSDANASAVAALLSRAGIPLHPESFGCAFANVYGANLSAGNADVGIGHSASCGGDGAEDAYQIRAGRVVARGSFCECTESSPAYQRIVGPYKGRAATVFGVVFAGQSSTTGAGEGTRLVAVPSLADFTGTWGGHTRGVTISSNGLARITVYDGCCDHVLDLTLHLSTPTGSLSGAFVNATVTAVPYLNPADYTDPSFPPPHVGQTAVWQLRQGVLRDTIDQTTFCDLGVVPGTCGA